MYVPVSVRIYWLPNKAVIYTINTLRQQTLGSNMGHYPKNGDWNRSENG